MSIINQDQLADITGFEQTSKIADYCRREGIRFKYNRFKKIYTTQKQLDDSFKNEEIEEIEFK